MNNAEALAKIQDAASARPARVDMSLQHAIQRRKGRNIQRQDVLYCLTTANNCAPDTIPGRWKVCGEDLDGDTLTLPNPPSETASGQQPEPRSAPPSLLHVQRPNRARRT